MNAQQYLQSKGIFMPEEKRRYKVVVRNGVSVFVLKSARLERNLRRLRIHNTHLATTKETERAIRAFRELGASWGNIKVDRFGF